jgi:hypothetical protein
MARFSKSQATEMNCVAEIESAAKAAYGFMHGLPIGKIIESQRPELMPEILQTLEEELRAELGDIPLRTPQKALIFEATK